jgi:TonB-linked SusC/RagA family outer membrane protein
MYVTKKNKIASLDYFRRVIKRQIESLPQNLTALDRLRLARLQHRLAQLEAIQTDVEQTGADRSIVWVCPMSDCEKHNANDDDVSTMFCAHCRRGPLDALAGGLGGNTNWYDEIFHTGTLQNYQLSASGGDTKTRFYASMNYNDNQGIVRKSQFERYSGRLNLDHVASEKLTLAVNLGYNYTKNQRIRNDNNIFGAVSVATLGPPTVPVYNADGSYGTAFGWDNPVASVTIYENLVTTSRTTGEAYARYEIIPGLHAKAKVGIDMLDLREAIFEPSALQSSVSGTGIGAQSREVRWLAEYTLAYQRQVGEVNLYAIAGAGYQEDRLEQTLGQVNDFPTDDFKGLSSGAIPTKITGDFSGDRLNSYFGNVNLTFRDKYILTLTGRADGSSRFVNDKWGFFPGVAAAWQIGDEPFMSDGIFDWLKLRAGYGSVGNNTIGNFTSLQLYKGGSNYQDAPGIAPFQLGNPDLTWETTTQFDVGVDFALLNSRLSGGIGFYIKKTKDLLFNLPIPTTSGFETVPRNIGDVENKGVEITLIASPVHGKGLNWDIGFNASYNKNEIVKLFNSQPVDAGFATRLAEGHPIGAFFGYVTDGVFQNQAEVEAHAIQPNAAPGDIRFKDISGGAGPDGILGTADRTAASWPCCRSWSPGAPRRARPGRSSWSSRPTST